MSYTDEHIDNMSVTKIYEKSQNLVENMDKDEEARDKLKSMFETWKGTPMPKKIKNVTMFAPTGKYFKYLRWLTFRIVENKDTRVMAYAIKILPFFENTIDVTGVFALEPHKKLYKLLETETEPKYFTYVDTDIVSISNTQIKHYASKELDKLLGKTRKGSSKRSNSKRRNGSRKNYTARKSRHSTKRAGKHKK